MIRIVGATTLCVMSIFPAAAEPRQATFVAELWDTASEAPGGAILTVRIYDHADLSNRYLRRAAENGQNVFRPELGDSYVQELDI